MKKMHTKNPYEKNPRQGEWNPRNKTEKYLSCKIPLQIRKNSHVDLVMRCSSPSPSKKTSTHPCGSPGGHECLSGMFNLRKRSVFGSAVGSRNRSANPIAFSLVPRLSSSCSGNKFNGMVNTTDRRVHRNPKP